LHRKDIWSHFNYPEILPRRQELIDKVIKTKNCIRNLEKYSYTDDLLYMLRSYGKVYCCTSIMVGGFYADERIDWLMQEAGFQREEIVLTHAKYLVQGDIFIDDKLENIINWAKENNGIPVLWNAPERKYEIQEQDKNSILENKIVYASCESIKDLKFLVKDYHSRI
jgi:5'(3')-deoxyribonucleotidase